MPAIESELPRPPRHHPPKPGPVPYRCSSLSREFLSLSVKVACGDEKLRMLFYIYIKTANSSFRTNTPPCCTPYPYQLAVLDQRSRGRGQKQEAGGLLTTKNPSRDGPGHRNCASCCVMLIYRALALAKPPTIQVRTLRTHAKKGPAPARTTPTHEIQHHTPTPCSPPTHT